VASSLTGPPKGAKFIVYLVYELSSFLTTPPAPSPFHATSVRRTTALGLSARPSSLEQISQRCDRPEVGGRRISRQAPLVSRRRDAEVPVGVPDNDGHTWVHRAALGDAVPRDLRQRNVLEMDAQVFRECSQVRLLLH